MSDDNTAGHNAKARADTIRKIMRAMDAIDSEIEPLKERMKDLKKRIKDDLDIKPSHFVLMRKLYLLEREERDDISDLILEAFEALGAGEQSSFLPVLEVREPEEDEDEDIVTDEHEDPDDPGDENDDGPRTSDIDVVPL